MHKGIVMEMTDRHIVVMRSDGKFDRISRKSRACEIGEEIVYASSGINWRSPSVAGRSAIAAAVIFCLVLFASFSGKLGSPEVAAYISMDINPSVEMGIDIDENVLELRGLNEDGVALIESVEFKGKKLEQVTEKLLDKAEQKALANGEAEIVIASTVVQPGSKLDDESIAAKLKEQVAKHIETTHPQQVKQYQITAFAAPEEVREAAIQNGVSTGKYSVYLNAKNSGADVTLEELKKNSVLKISKIKPEVAQSIQLHSLPTKDGLKKLMQEEKTGELDKKVAEKKAGLDKRTAPNGRTNKDDSKKPGLTGSSPDDKNDENDHSDDRKNTNANTKLPTGTTKPSAGGQGSSRDDNKKDSRKDNNADKKDNTNNKKDNSDDKKDSNNKKDNSDSSKRDNNDDKKDNNDDKIKEEAKRLEDLRKQAEEKKQQEEERRKKQEEDRKLQEESKKKQEDDRKKQEQKNNASKSDDAKSNDNDKKDD